MEISQLQNALLVYGDWLTNQLILFENLFKPRQLPSATSKHCFEQPAARFLVCSLIFIEYKTHKKCPQAGFSGSIIFVVGESPMDIMEPILL